MSAAVPQSFPWISIPQFAQPGQPHAFANREEQVAQLYKAIVAAGNAVRAGQSGVRQRYVVHGYMGVGKSSLILQVLGMVRDELAVAEGQQFSSPVGLPEPQDRERWLMLRVSGKHVGSIDAIADALQKIILTLLKDVHDEAERRIPHALDLSIFHRLFRTREAKLFGEVRTALQVLANTISFVREWQGSAMTTKLEQGSHTETSRGEKVKTQLEAVLKARGVELGVPEVKAAIEVAADYLHKSTSTFNTSMSVERQAVVSAEFVVDALNAFFKATDRAGVPTILVLDDFDEFASNVGVSYRDRSRVLSGILGTFNQLTPTFLILGLREEYMDVDVNRQFHTVAVPPMTRTCAGKAMAAWAAVQQPPLDAPIVEALKSLGDRFLTTFQPDDPVVVPYRYLHLVGWLANNVQLAGKSSQELVRAYLRNTFAPEANRAVLRVAQAMPEADIVLCAETAPLDPAPYAFTDRERTALTQAGLLRPALAGDSNDPRVVLDPLCAYLRASSQQTT